MNINIYHTFVNESSGKLSREEQIESKGFPIATTLPDLYSLLERQKENHFTTWKYGRNGETAGAGLGFTKNASKV